MTRAFNIDCNVAMKEFPDKFFNLAIVDPPFGIGENWNKDTQSKFYGHESSYKNAMVPDQNYFDELFRVSKFQIIWGCNYYWNFLKPTNNLIFWDKGIEPEKHLRSAGNLAWTNITKYPFNRVMLWWCGAITCEPRTGIHPHESPVMLYEWLLTKYAQPGWKILDTHLGSGSSRIAADKMNFDFWGYELDKQYFDAQENRFETRQLHLQL